MVAPQPSIIIRAVCGAPPESSTTRHISQRFPVFTATPEKATIVNIRGLASGGASAPLDGSEHRKDAPKCRHLLSPVPRTALSAEPTMGTPKTQVTHVEAAPPQAGGPASSSTCPLLRTRSTRCGPVVHVRSAGASALRSRARRRRPAALADGLEDRTVKRASGRRAIGALVEFTSGKGDYRK